MNPRNTVLTTLLVLGVVAVVVFVIVLVVGSFHSCVNPNGPMC